MEQVTTIELPDGRLIEMEDQIIIHRTASYSGGSSTEGNNRFIEGVRAMRSCDAKNRGHCLSECSLEFVINGYCLGMCLDYVEFVYKAAKINKVSEV